MEPFKLYFPAKPFRLTQAWGILNPIYQQFGFTRHNGVDFALGADSKLYAPAPGTVVRVGYQPTGAGHFLSIMTPAYTWADTSPKHVLIDLMHCKAILVKEGDKVEVGTPLAIANNTGFSTGPHTHIQVRRASHWNGQSGAGLGWDVFDSNEANNSLDPARFWQKVHAQDYLTLIGHYHALIAALKALLGK